MLFLDLNSTHQVKWANLRLSPFVLFFSITSSFRAFKNYYINGFVSLLNSSRFPEALQATDIGRNLYANLDWRDSLWFIRYSHKRWTSTCGFIHSKSLINITPGVLVGKLNQIRVLLDFSASISSSIVYRDSFNNGYFSLSFNSSVYYIIIYSSS